MPRPITGWDTFAKLRDNRSGRAAPTVVQLYPDADRGFMKVECPGAGNAQAVNCSWPQAVAFLTSSLSAGR